LKPSAQKPVPPAPAPVAPSAPAPVAPSAPEEEAAPPAPSERPCSLAIASRPPRARIFVDGRAVGRAPATLPLTCRAAPYRIVLAGANRSPWERNVTLDREQVTVIAALARRGSLSVNAIPWANIFIDGRPAGHTPRRGVPLDAGRHLVKLVTQAGDVRTRNVAVAEGRESKVTVVFSEP
jgi:hypothetical protein